MVKEYIPTTVANPAALAEELKSRFHLLLEKRGFEEKYRRLISDYNDLLDNAKEVVEKLKGWLERRILADSQIMNMQDTLRFTRPEYLKRLYEDWLKSMDEGKSWSLWRSLQKETGEDVFKKKYKELNEDSKDFKEKLERLRCSSRESLRELKRVVDKLFNKTKAEYSLTPLESVSAKETSLRGF